MLTVKEKRAIYNKETNKQNYARNKKLFESNPDAKRTCSNCKTEKTLKYFYQSDIYNCKECFKEKVSIRKMNKKLIK